MSEPINPAYKSSNSRTAFGIDWSDVLQSNELIIESVWQAPESLVISRQQNIDGITSCLIAGGVSGEQYKVYNKITTSDEGVDERYFLLKVRDIQVSM